MVVDMRGQGAEVWARFLMDRPVPMAKPPASMQLELGLESAATTVNDPSTCEAVVVDEGCGPRLMTELFRRLPEWRQLWSDEQVAQGMGILVHTWFDEVNSDWLTDSQVSAEVVHGVFEAFLSLFRPDVPKAIQDAAAYWLEQTEAYFGSPGQVVAPGAEDAFFAALVEMLERGDLAHGWADHILTDHLDDHPRARAINIVRKTARYGKAPVA